LDRQIQIYLRKKNADWARLDGLHGRADSEFRHVIGTPIGTTHGEELEQEHCNGLLRSHACCWTPRRLSHVPPPLVERAHAAKRDARRLPY
jgi:hypothetical protein